MASDAPPQEAAEVHQGRGVFTVVFDNTPTIDLLQDVLSRFRAAAEAEGHPIAFLTDLGPGNARTKGFCPIERREQLAIPPSRKRVWRP